MRLEARSKDFRAYDFRQLESPPQVGGQLTGLAVERMAAGAHHVCVLASPVDPRSLGRGGGGGDTPRDYQAASGFRPGARVVLAWGRGAGGQLGSGTSADSALPRVVDGGLKGRQLLQVGRFLPEGLLRLPPADLVQCLVVEPV